MIAHANGRVAVNTSGNPGMAKGGSGDLLTGLIAGLLAQHPGEAARAVEAAVYLHGLAGGPGGARRATSTRCWPRTSLNIFHRLFACGFRTFAIMVERVCLVAGAAGGCIDGRSLARGQQ
jgi:hypothetical protein